MDHKSLLIDDVNPVDPRLPEIAQWILLSVNSDLLDYLLPSSWKNGEA